MEHTINCQEGLITEIYKKYFSDVKLYFLKYTRDEMMAEDMVQDLFVKLMNYEEMIVGETARSFVFTIAHRMVVDDARHRQFVRRATERWLLEQERVWRETETLECKQIRELEIKKLRTMPKRMAQVYELTRFHGLSSAEIAEQMQISKRTVEYHLLVSRKEMRQSMKMAINL